MTLSEACQFIGEVARPISIVFLAGSAGVGTFTHVDVAALTVIAGMFGIAVGARSYENHATIKADASVKIAEKTNGQIPGTT